MNQSRRTFFKRLGMLAAMPFLAKFLPEGECFDTKDVQFKAFFQTKHPDSVAWNNTNVSEPLSERSLYKAMVRARERHYTKIFNDAFRN